jgi:hypothetical protein
VPIFAKELSSLPNAGWKAGLVRAMIQEEPIFDSSWPKRGYHNQLLTVNNNEVRQVGKVLLSTSLQHYGTELRASTRSRKCRTADASPLGVRPKGRAKAGEPGRSKVCR